MINLTTTDWTPKARRAVTDPAQGIRASTDLERFYGDGAVSMATRLKEGDP